MQGTTVPQGCLSGACPRATSGYDSYSPYTNCIAIHAEVNALLHSAHDGGTLYITDAPCADCRSAIDTTTLVRVVWPEGEWVRES